LNSRAILSSSFSFPAYGFLRRRGVKGLTDVVRLKEEHNVRIAQVLSNFVDHISKKVFEQERVEPKVWVIVLDACGLRWVRMAFVTIRRVLNKGYHNTRKRVLPEK